MRSWIRANGGPLAIVVVGLGILGVTSRSVGVGLVVVGSVWFLLSLSVVRRRIPWRVVRKQALATQRISEQELGRRCLALAERVEERLGEEARSDPRTLNWGLSSVDPFSDEQQRAQNEHRAKLEGWFTAHCQGEASFLFAELRSQGLVTREDEGVLWSFPESSASVHDLGFIAAFLATAGRRLRGDEPLEH